MLGTSEVTGCHISDFFQLIHALPGGTIHCRPIYCEFFYGFSNTLGCSILALLCSECLDWWDLGGSYSWIESEEYTDTG